MFIFVSTFLTIAKSRKTSKKTHSSREFPEIPAANVEKRQKRIYKKIFFVFFSPRNKEKKMVCAFDIIRQISDLVVEKFAEEEFVEEEEEGHIEFISPRPTYDEILNSEAFTDAEDMLNEFEEEPTTARFFWVSVNDIVLDRFNEEEIHYRIHEKRFWYSVINHFFEDEKEYTGGISSEDFIEYWRYYLQMI